jgi:hypothetical protein
MLQISSGKTQTADCQYFSGGKLSDQSLLVRCRRTQCTRTRMPHKVSRVHAQRPRGGTQASRRCSIEYNVDGYLRCNIQEIMCMPQRVSCTRTARNPCRPHPLQHLGSAGRILHRHSGARSRPEHCHALQRPAVSRPRGAHPADRESGSKWNMKRSNGELYFLCILHLQL